jgi:hypothetical protein
MKFLVGTTADVFDLGSPMVFFVCALTVQKPASNNSGMVCCVFIKDSIQAQRIGPPPTRGVNRDSAISLRSEAAARLDGDWLQRELV